MSELPAQNDPEVFTMHGAREILLLSAGAIQIEKTIVALENSVHKNPSFAFDLAKALVESVCKTILTDRGQTPNGTPDLPKLIKETTKELKLVPESHDGNTQVKDSLKKTLNGLSVVIQGLCELRTYEGMASHGRDGYVKELEPLQAQLAARAADTIVHFIFKAHKNGKDLHENTRISYGDYSDFDNDLDDSYDPIMIFDLPYKLSEVLFRVDQQAYFDLLSGYLNRKNTNGGV